MSDWSGGYVTDIPYTHGYYIELNPLRLQLAFASAGLAMPEVVNACELGFGQGISLNAHAAATAATWVGTDFAPGQAAFADALAQGAGNGAQLYEDDFATFCARPELPQFDFIALHGIWSWIDDDNRAVIVDFVRRKLKQGGVLYISYNTQPGWANFGPMQHLLRQHAERMGVPGEGSLEHAEGALAFAERLLQTQPRYAAANPAAGERLGKLREQNAHYLAHEYLNRDWHPMPVAEMAEWLEPAKLTFACSAHMPDHVDAINLTGEQQQLLAELKDPLFGLTVRDLMVNQGFRRDYWVKGAQMLTALEQHEAFCRLRLLLTTPRDDVPLKVAGSLGEANLNEAIYNPVLDALADHEVHDYGELLQNLEGRVNAGQLQQAVTLLAGGGHIRPAQAVQQAEAAEPACRNLNAALMQRARSRAEINWLISPVVAGAVSVSRFEQLFLLARSEGAQQPEQWAEAAWRLLAMQQQKLVKEGKAVESDEENLAMLREQAERFAERRLPILQTLKIA